jgi:periplasmic protein TonB
MMDYAKQQRDPARHIVGIGFVVLFHALLIYALITGLGKQMVEVIKKPLSATIIEEIKAPPPPPPPPPPKKIIEPPKVQVQQPYVPPPDIPPPVAPSEPVIASVAPTPPPEPVAIAPPPVEAPPAPPPKPAIRQGVSCGRMEKPSFPREAIKAGVQKGQVHAILTIDEKGNVADVKITQAEPARVFDRVVRETLVEWKCAADGTKYQASVEINFTLKDE